MFYNFLHITYVAKVYCILCTLSLEFGVYFIIYYMYMYIATL